MLQTQKRVLHPSLLPGFPLRTLSKQTRPVLREPSNDLSVTLREGCLFPCGS